MVAQALVSAHSAGDDEAADRQIEQPVAGVGGQAVGKEAEAGIAEGADRVKYGQVQ